MSPRRISPLGLAAILLVLAAAFPFTATAAVLGIEDLRIAHEAFRLDNGLTVIVHEDHAAPIVAVNVWYHVGSRNEKVGRTGFAHLFEHFFFNGSENYPFGFREAMDDLGVNNRNGTTNTDRTNFFEDVPVSALERTLYLEADRMGFLAGQITEESLERERGVVKNEKRQGENQPYGRSFSRITETIYPAGHPYSWSTIGRMEDLDAATLDDVKEWYATYYGPNNAVLALAGDITVERARELVEKYFGAIPPGPPTGAHERWIPRFERDIREVMQDRVPQTRIFRVYHSPDWGDAEVAQLELAAGVLSGSKSSRLDRRLIYEDQLVTSVGAFVMARELSGLFFLTADVKPGVDPTKVEAAIDEEIARLIKQGPSPEELERSKNRWLANLARGLERLGGFGGRSDVLAESATYSGRPDAYLALAADLIAAQPATVTDTARTWLDAAHYTMVVEPFPDFKAEESDLDRSVLPKLGEPGEVTFPEIQTTTLDNGLEVWLLERHSAPLVNVTLAIDAGYAADGAGRAGTGALALSLLDDGSEKRTGFELIDELDRLGASIFTNSTLDLSMVRLRSLSSSFAQAMDLFADVVLQPAYPEDLVALEVRRTIARIEQERAQPIGAALRTVPPLLYGEGHAYALPMTGSGYPKTVEAIDRSSLVTWHRQWFQPNASKLVVAGDLTMAQLRPIVERAFGSWQRGDTPKKNLAQVAEQSRGKVFLIDRPGAPQSVIVAAHLAAPSGTDSDIAAETFLRLFGGMSTSRLNRNLRLDKHWSYGASGRMMDARGQRPFLVIAPVQTDKTKEAIVEVQGEIRGIAGERPVEGEELASILRNMELRLPGRFETLSSLESAALDSIAFGYPLDYYQRYAEQVRALDGKKINQTAGELIAPERLMWMILGDLEKIEAGVRELDLGAIQRIDVR